MGDKVGVIRAGQVDFPEELSEVEPPVARLFYRGVWRREILARCVAVVGSRKMTKYGAQVLATVIPQLVARGYTTISGFMYGVDMEVHRLTYLCGGCTIAVLGWGIERKNDIEQSNLLYKLIDNGGLIVSEYEGEMLPQKFMFPARNRIVAAFAQDVIVIEGAKKSGSMITAGIATKLGRRLWAVPGPVNSIVSEGTNDLIRRGVARMLTFDEIDLVGANERGGKTRRQKNYSKKIPINTRKVDLSAEEFTLITQIKTRRMGINDLVRATEIPAARVAALIMGLEMKGVVREEEGVFELVQN